MPKGKESKIRVRIIVKAFPQPSQKYQETVCCAGIREDTHELLRLFPIRYRRLSKNSKFKRYDLVEMRVKRASDARPESYHVDEDSISIVEHATKSNFSDEQRASLWKPHIYSSLSELEIAQKERKVSLGIIRPDITKFEYRPIDRADDDTQDMISQQVGLFEDPLKPMMSPEYEFRYRFNSGDSKHTRAIMDWEVQAAYYNFKRTYGDRVFEALENQYANVIPKQNLHFVMGTMAKRQYQFILIGLLRSPVSPEDAARQGDLF